MNFCSRRATGLDASLLFFPTSRINNNAPIFPVAEHFSSNGHTPGDALVCGTKLCDGNKQRKRQEMRLIFRLGTCQLRGLNADFQFI